MKPAPFRYHAPKTIDEAVSILAEVAPHDGRVLAGGQTLVPVMMTTALAEDELLIEVQIPLLAPDVRFGFYEFNRRACDFAIATALATYRINGGTIADARITVGGAEPHPRRITDAEQALTGRVATASVFNDAAERAALAINPMEDAANSAEYRREIVRTVTRRALEQSLA